MNQKITYLILCFLFLGKTDAQQVDSILTKQGLITIQPIHHASFVITANNKTIYIDPTGGVEAFNGIHSPDIILITDIHGDHHDQKTIDAIIKPNTIVIAPNAVAIKMTNIAKSNLVVLNNGEQTLQNGFSIKAIPMYNLPQSDSSKHTKGRGNGYIVTINGKNIYISGDTDGIQEMRQLKNIDIAFVCMNPPYTMDVDQAANATLEFKPKIVYPYHYRGSKGLNDIQAFKNAVNKGNKAIDVRLRDWYSSK